MQPIRSLAVGLHGGTDDRFQALRRAEIAGKHQIEPARKLGVQGFVRLGNGVKIFTVLRNHGNLCTRLAGALHQALAQPLAHGNEPVGPAVVPVADPVGNAAPERAFHRENRVKVFRPDVQHIIGNRDVMALAVHQGGQAH